MPQSPASPSLKTLAAALGVSVATVSRVLSGQAERYRISVATRTRVLEAASASGIVVDQLARSLRLRRTLSIGLVIPDISNPFFAQLARQIERHARRHGYSVLIADSEEDAEVEAQAIRLMLSRRVDGLILAPVGTPATSAPLRSLGARPCVLVDRLLDDPPLPAVTSDHRRGAEIATLHLIERGHRRIACVQGSPGTFANDERIAGWRTAMAASGLPCGPERVAGTGYSIDAAVAAAHALLMRGERPTGILALGNVLALGVLQAARDARISIPDDLSLVAFDDQLWAAVTSPPLTIIEQPIEALGREVLELLLARIASPTGGPPTRHILPVRLIERGSVSDLRHRNPTRVPISHRAADPSDNATRRVAAP
ncbi:MAG: LacI family DNA-binding transcriptional regulator [Pseudomonadota bacterium]